MPHKLAVRDIRVRATPRIAWTRNCGNGYIAVDIARYKINVVYDSRKLFHE